MKARRIHLARCGNRNGTIEGAHNAHDVPIECLAVFRQANVAAIAHEQLGLQIVFHRRNMLAHDRGPQKEMASRRRETERLGQIYEFAKMFEFMRCPYPDKATLTHV